MAPYQETTRALAEPGAGGTTLAAALQKVSAQLDAPGLTSGKRMRLLQRQAELGDLRDELELRERRRSGTRR